jgi:zinc transporter ZupT
MATWIESRTFASFLATVCLAFLHALASQLKFLDTKPRSQWLSFAGGVAVAYALMYLLPELGRHTQLARQHFGPGLSTHLVYAVSLSGLILFYGIDWYVERVEPDGEQSAALFWSHIATFATYNAIIGYVLVREDRSITQLAFYTIGIGLHFVVNDDGLCRNYPRRYRRFGRWILAGGIAIGWLIGTVTSIHELISAGMTAFLAGGILLNTFKEELPAERESRFSAFALGCIAYTGILILA